MRDQLADRLRAVIGGHRAPPVPQVSSDVRGSTGSSHAEPIVPHTRTVHVGRATARAAADVLGGDWRDASHGSFIVVERFYPAAARYGRFSIGTIVERLGTGRDALALLARAWPSAQGVGEEHAEGLLFLDLETTGLAGGAGTQAFLIGSAAIERAGIRVRQYLLPGLEHERALLAEVASWAVGRNALVTYNGRTFDVPLIETRFLFHRLEFPLASWPHLDMLHPARRLWKARPAVAGPPFDEDSCRLSVLERHLAGVHRIGDVPGLEIPSRFFRFIRDGDARPLQAVLEHNRLDLLSLALVTAHAITLITHGPSATVHGHECFGLGRVYELAGAPDEAEACYARAAALARACYQPSLQAEALRRLALCRRRAGRPHEAAAAWGELAALPGTPASLRQEAREALAIYYEHRVKDLETARRLVLDTLTSEHEARRREAAHYRLSRIERKQTSLSGPLIPVMEA